MRNARCCGAAAQVAQWKILIEKLKNKNPATRAKCAMRKVAALRRKSRNGELTEKMKNKNPATCAKHEMRKVVALRRK